MHRRIPTLTPPLLDMLWLTVLSWLGLMVTVAGVAIGISLFADVTSSVLDPVSHAAGWFAVFLGGYLTHDVLALHITHGQTRRSFAQMAGLFVLAFSGLVALLISGGYLIERILYRIGGWPHRVDADRLFSSPTHVPLVFFEYLLTVLLWTTAGALVGAAVYRYGSDGWLMLPVSVILIDIGGVALGFGWGPVTILVHQFDGSWGASTLHPLLAISICLLAIGLAAAATWPIIRDVPIRQTKS